MASCVYRAGAPAYDAGRNARVATAPCTRSTCVTASANVRAPSRPTARTSSVFIGHLPRSARAYASRRLLRWRSLRLRPVLGMSGIVGRHERPGPHAFHQGPTVVRLLVVVVAAVAVEAVEGRAAGAGPVLAVVPLAGGGRT